MQGLEQILKNKLRGAKKIAILGIGSDLRADDAAGVLAMESAAKRLKRSGKARNVRAFNGATAPENLTGVIKRFAPGRIIIIDAAEMGQKPGTILVADPADVGGATFSTHTMPAKILAEYFLKSFKCVIIIIGIQPKSVAFGGKVCREVKAAVRIVSDAIVDALKKV